MKKWSVLTLCFLYISNAFCDDLAIVHYKLELGLHPASRSMNARVAFSVYNNSKEAVDSIDLILSYNSISSVTGIDNAPVKYSALPSGIKVNLKIPSHDTGRINIEYASTFTGWVSANINPKSSWLLAESGFYPRLSSDKDMSNRFTFDLKIRVPAPLYAVSSGILTSVEYQGDDRIFNWSSHIPLSLISISAAKYCVDSIDAGGRKLITYLYPEDSGQNDSLVKYWLPVFKFYQTKYGPFEYGDLRIVETDRRGGYGPAGMIMLSKDNITIKDRMDEFLLFHEMAHQWWGNTVQFSGNERRLVESMATYSVFSFWRHSGVMNEAISLGKNVKIPFLKLNLDYKLGEFDRLRNHMIYEPGVFRDSDGIMTSYDSWLLHYKMNYLINMLDLTVGTGKFDSAMKLFIVKTKFSSGSFSDLVTITEKLSGKELLPFVEEWMTTKKTIDLGISDLTSRPMGNGKFSTTIKVRNTGSLPSPAELQVFDKSGRHYNIPHSEMIKDTITFSIVTDYEAEYAEIDPYFYILDANRTNNIYPRKFSFTFFSDAPSAATQQYFYYPTITFGKKDGIRSGLWLTNSAPVTNILSLNSLPMDWTAGLMYGVKTKRLGYSAEIRTSLFLPSHYWEWNLAAAENRGRNNYHLGINYYILRDLKRNRYNQLSFNIRKTAIFDLAYYDNRDFEYADLTIAEISWKYNLMDRNIKASFMHGSKILGSQFSFSRVNLEYSNSVSLSSIIINFRCFGGIIRGTFPQQQNIFLYGNVNSDGIPYIFVDPDRNISTQENIHVPGDVNLRGYIGQHIRGKNGAGVNFVLMHPALKYINLFFDAGNVWDREFGKIRFDIGTGIDLVYFKAYFPMFVDVPEKGKKRIDFRYLLELSLPFATK